MFAPFSQCNFHLTRSPPPAQLGSGNSHKLRNSRLHFTIFVDSIFGGSIRRRTDIVCEENWIFIGFSFHKLDNCETNGLLMDIGKWETHRRRHLQPKQPRSITETANLFAAVAKNNNLQSPANKVVVIKSLFSYTVSNKLNNCGSASVWVLSFSKWQCTFNQIEVEQHVSRLATLASGKSMWHCERWPFEASNN